MTNAKATGMNLLMIAGFLGSGKTTLILSLARHLVEERGQKIAVLVNEYGEIGVDDKVLRLAGLQVKELFSGCICCQLTTDLALTLEKLAAGYQPDTVIVEPSGVAQPANVLQVVLKYRGHLIDRVRTAVLLDPTRLPILFEVAEPLITGQIQSADLLVLNKIDAAPEEEIAASEEIARSLNPAAPLFKVSARAGMNLESLLAALEM